MTIIHISERSVCIIWAVPVYYYFIITPLDILSQFVFIILSRFSFTVLSLFCFFLYQISSIMCWNEERIQSAVLFWDVCVLYIKFRIRFNSPNVCIYWLIWICIQPALKLSFSRMNYSIKKKPSLVFDEVLPLLLLLKCVLMICKKLFLILQLRLQDDWNNRILSFFGICEIRRIEMFLFNSFPAMGF